MGAHRVPDWAVAQRQVLEEPRGPDSRSPSDAAEAMRTHVSPRGAVLLDLTFITVTMETARARVTNWLHYPLVDAPLPGDLDAIPCQPPTFSQTAFIRELAELESWNLALAAPPLSGMCREVLGCLVKWHVSPGRPQPRPQTQSTPRSQGLQVRGGGVCRGDQDKIVSRRMFPDGAQTQGPLKIAWDDARGRASAIRASRRGFPWLEMGVGAPLSGPQHPAEMK
nr:uncharacterized protein LOC123285615 isoform X1 [Equus asinus]